MHPKGLKKHLPLWFKPPWKDELKVGKNDMVRALLLLVQYQSEGEKLNKNSSTKMNRIQIFLR